MVKAPSATEASALVTPVKVRKPRSKEGAAEAKAAATMTLEEWRKLQAGMGELWPAPDYMAMPMPGRSHTNYRDETYAFITRWMAETKIAYRPHAKSPGSKSHLRYEKYAKATTVKEALELGSYPQDWCWDYERGFIKVEGPVRAEPIDIVQCTDTNALTEVDKIIYRWYNKELAKILCLDYKDLFGTSDPSILRAHRLVAQREARSRLEAAEREGRRISDEDVLSTLKQWAFVKNAARSNVIPEGQEWVWSDTLGLIRDRLGSIHSTPATKLYPEVVQVLVKWLNDRLPQEAAGFRFTSINLNCNYAARLHRDGNNFGPSFIKAFGDFTGGLVAYHPCLPLRSHAPGAAGAAAVGVQYYHVLQNFDTAQLKCVVMLKHVVMLRELLAQLQSEYYHALPLQGCHGCMVNETFADSLATNVALLQHQPPLMSDDKGMDLESLPEAKGVALDIGSSAEGGLALFNGNSAHSVEAFQGTRYSVVFFTLGCHDRAVQEDRDFLSSLGVSFPRPDEERYGLLRAPRGYGLRPPATPMRDTRPAVMFFKNSDLEAREFVPKPLQKVEPLNPAGTRQSPQEAQATPAKRAPKAAAKSKAASGGKVRKLQLKRPGPVATGAASSASSSSAPTIIEVL